MIEGALHKVEVRHEMGQVARRVHEALDAVQAEACHVLGGDADLRAIEADEAHGVQGPRHCRPERVHVCVVDDHERGVRSLPPEQVPAAGQGGPAQSLGLVHVAALGEDQGFGRVPPRHPVEHHVVGVPGHERGGMPRQSGLVIPGRSPRQDVRGARTSAARRISRGTLSPPSPP